MRARVRVRARVRLSVRVRVLVRVRFRGLVLEFARGTVFTAGGVVVGLVGAWAARGLLLATRRRVVARRGGLTHPEAAVAGGVVDRLAVLGVRVGTLRTRHLVRVRARVKGEGVGEGG